MMTRPSVLTTLGLSALLLTGCTGMNSEFQFDKPARDSGIWMSQADDMSAGASRSAPAAGHINLDDYPLMDTGSIRLDPQMVAPEGRPAGMQAAENVPLRTAGTGVRPFTRVNDSLQVSRASGEQGAWCGALHCFPEPSAAFRRPDSVARIWIAPYVSPDNSAHMGEVIYTVTAPSDWHGLLL